VIIIQTGKDSCSDEEDHHDNEDGGDCKCNYCKRNREMRSCDYGRPGCYKNGHDFVLPPPPPHLYPFGPNGMNTYPYGGPYPEEQCHGAMLPPPIVE